MCDVRRELTEQEERWLLIGQLVAAQHDADRALNDLLREPSPPVVLPPRQWRHRTDDEALSIPRLSLLPGPDGA
jgi:hypothetical protein